MSMADPSSHSNPQQVKASHLHLNVDVDFKTCTISGSVEFEIEVQEEGVTELVLDTRDLTIKKTAVDGVDVEFKLGEPDEIFGSALSIPLSGGWAGSGTRSKGSKAKVIVHYNTSPNSTACAWLPPPQTAGKKKPFMFTQCQAIHARSLLPCQDCPRAKCTWSAQVSAPKWATVLMSALLEKGGEKLDKGLQRWTWKQPMPTCSYLIAIAVGDLQGKDISERCKIWAEPSMVAAAASEFQDTEKFLKIAESLTCPYQWQRYDVLCLPPSFPYGGMENPCLTFVTPTLLAGDRSLADVIAHEIAHSWTGNLVTNATWEHFWLNEGWTMWLERRIMMHVEAEKRGVDKPLKADFDFLAAGGWTELSQDVSHFVESGSSPLTKLVPDLAGIDPDDAFSLVPYEKGFNLLYALQTLVGDDAFLAFVKAYIQEFKSKLITSEDFKKFAIAQFKDKIAGFDWDAWFYSEGMPPHVPEFDETVGTFTKSIADAWFYFEPDVALFNVGGKTENAEELWAKWSSVQKQYLLDRLLENTANVENDRPEKALSVAKLNEMDRLYGLTKSKNCELRFRWCTLCLRCGADFILDTVVEMLSTQGRMKYTRPLYRDLASFNQGAGKSLALKTFNKNRKFYHPICRKMLAQDLGVDQEVDLSGGAIPWPAVAVTIAVGVAAFSLWRLRNRQ